MIDISDWELHNCVAIGGQLQSRPALQLHANSSATSGSWVGGFSIESPNTSEVWHYLFAQTSDGTVTGYVKDEEYNTVYSVTVGHCPTVEVITYGVVNSELMIGSPQFPFPIYGVIGSGLRSAQKVSSINPDTTALDIPVGILTQFDNRIAIAQYNTVYISDPDAPRTYVAQNAFSVSSKITDLFQGPGGLYIVTENGVHVLTADAIGQGQEISGSIQHIPGYSAFGWRNTVATNGVVLGLYDQGIVTIDEALERIPAITYRGKRYYTPRIEIQDMRYGRIFRTENGATVSIDGKWYEINLKANYRSWHWSSGTGTPVTIDLKGVLTGRDGQSLYLVAAGVLEMAGDTEYGSNTVRALACGQLPITSESPKQLPGQVLRHVHTTSNNVGANQIVYVQGTARSAATLAASDSAVIGTAAWSASATYTGRQERQRRHDFALRTSDPQAEVGIEGPNRTLTLADVEWRGHSRRRPDQ